MATSQFDFTDNIDVTAQDDKKLIDIYNSFARTEHGMLLAGRVRYEKYKPGSVSNEQWVRLLGPDVNNLSHLIVTYGMTRNFVEQLEKVQPDLLSQEEGTTLMVAALIHDWAESKVGDISFGDKTAETETDEQTAFDRHLHEFYTGSETEIIDRARREVVFDHNGQGKLGNMFNAIERVGYLRTALRAMQCALGDDSACESSFRWIAADVLSNQIPALLTYAQIYKPINDYLANQSDAITAAFELVDAHRGIFANYGPNQASKLAEFEHAQKLWRTRQL